MEICFSRLFDQNFGLSQRFFRCALHVYNIISVRNRYGQRDPIDSGFDGAFKAFHVRYGGPVKHPLGMFHPFHEFFRICKLGNDLRMNEGGDLYIFAARAEQCLDQFEFLFSRDNFGFGLEPLTRSHLTDPEFFR